MLRGSLIAALSRFGAEAEGPSRPSSALRWAEEARGEAPPKLPLGLEVAPLPPEQQIAELDARWRVVLRRDAAGALGRLARVRPRPERPSRSWPPRWTTRPTT